MYENLLLLVVGNYCSIYSEIFSECIITIVCIVVIIFTVIIKLTNSELNQQTDPRRSTYADASRVLNPSVEQLEVILKDVMQLALNCLEVLSDAIS